MPFQILLQRAPFTVRAIVTHLETAKRGAQIIANTRGEYLAVCRMPQPPAWGCVVTVAPAGIPLEPYRTYHARTLLQDSRRENADAARDVRSFRAYQRKCGRNLSKALSLFASIYREHADGFVRMTCNNSRIEAEFNDGRREYVAFASWYRQAAGTIRIVRSGCASIHPDGSRTTDFLAVEMENGARGRACSVTSYGGRHVPA